MRADRRRALIAWLRWEPAVRLLPVTCVVAYLAATGTTVQSPGYPLALAVRGHLGLIVIAPVGAGCAAWKAGRFRRGGWTRRAWTRARSTIGLAEVGSTAIVQLVAYVVVRIAVTTTAATPSARFVVEPQLLLVAAAVTAGWAAIGFVIGWYLRTEPAMPLVIVGSYLAMVFPPAMDPLWLRHLTGVYDGCCQYDAVLAPGAVRGATMLALGVGAGALALLEAGAQSVPGRAVFVVAALVVAGLSATVAIQGVDHLGADPVRPREGAIGCVGGEPTVCTWPEVGGDRDRIAADAARVVRRWQAAGVAPPDQIAPHPVDGVGRTLVASLQPGQRADDITWTLAQAAIGSPRCDGGASEVFDAGEVATAWLAVVGGVPRVTVADQIGTELGRRVTELLAAPEAARRAWLSAVEHALVTCEAGDVPPTPR